MLVKYILKNMKSKMQLQLTYQTGSTTTIQSDTSKNFLKKRITWKLLHCLAYQCTTKYIISLVMLQLSKSSLKLWFF